MNCTSLDKPGRAVKFKECPNVIGLDIPRGQQVHQKLLLSKDRRSLGGIGQMLLPCSFFDRNGHALGGVALQHPQKRGEISRPGQKQQHLRCKKSQSRRFSGFIQKHVGKLAPRLDCRVDPELRTKAPESQDESWNRREKTMAQPWFIIIFPPFSRLGSGGESPRDKPILAFFYPYHPEIFI